MIAAELPNKFGLVIDGWAKDRIHYICVFGSYATDNGKLETPLLAMYQLPDLTNQRAKNHVVFITNVLQDFGKTIDNVVCLSADNTNLNPCIARLLGIQFVGCFSHRMNLAVQEMITAEEERLFEKADLLMAQINSSANMRGRLLKFTDLHRKRRSYTRWSSTWGMLQRFLEMWPTILAPNIGI
jgi:hypothetical protein